MKGDGGNYSGQMNSFVRGCVQRDGIQMKLMIMDFFLRIRLPVRGRHSEVQTDTFDDQRRVRHCQRIVVRSNATSARL